MVDIKFHCDEQGNFHGGFLVRAFTYTDYSIEMHNHDFYEVNIVLSGSGVHCIESGKFPVKVGDVFVIPPTVAHAYTDTKKLEVYHILLQKDYFNRNKKESERVSGFIRLTEIEPFLRSNSSNPFFLHLTQNQLMQLKNDITIIDDSGIFPWERYSAMKYHTVWKILYWFSALLDEQVASADNKTSNKYELQIIKALEYIHKNYGEKITVDMLCREVYLSRSTFLRSFKAVCGIPPMDYLSGYRCQKAAEQTKAACSSKTEIAHRCGFYDLSHMERMLKKYHQL